MDEYGGSETRQGATHPAPGGPTAAGASRGAWCLADGSVDKLVHDVEVRPDPERLERPRAAVDAAPDQGRPREPTGDARGVQDEPEPARMRHKGDQLPEGSHADAATAAAAGTTEGSDSEPPGSGPAAERPEVRAGPLWLASLHDTGAHLRHGHGIQAKACCCCDGDGDSSRKDLLRNTCRL